MTFAKANDSFDYDAIITDAAQRVSLELARCLGKKGLRLLLIEKETSKGAALASRTRYCFDFKTVPDYKGHEFYDLCARSRSVFPVSTNTVIQVIAKAPPEFSSRFLLPDPDLFRQVNSKSKVVDIARAAGAPFPETRILSADEAPDFPDIQFPSVFKLLDDEGLFLEPVQRYSIVRNRDQAEAAWLKLKIHGKEIVVQEYVDGPGYGWSAIYDKNGDCVTGIGHRRLREYPISGGPSSFCESVKEPDLAKAGKLVLDSLRWRGPAMVEFKRDRASGEFKILEINPRYWGSLPLARFAGINLPYSHYQILIGETPDRKLDYREGTKLKFLAMDLAAAFQELKESPRKIRFLMNYLAECLNPRISDGIWSWSDPKPFIFYLLERIFK